MALSVRCLFLGHEDMMVRAPERLRLRCDRCGRETAGWTLTGSHRRREVRRAPVAVDRGMALGERRQEEPIAA